jgi:hypothetical protein
VLFTEDLNNDFLLIDARNGDTLYRFNDASTSVIERATFTRFSARPRKPER